MSERVLPEGWVETTLGQVVEYGKAEKATREQVGDDTWVLELEDIEKSSSRIIQRLNFSERQFKSTKNRFKKGDVLYGKLRPYLEKVVIADRDGVCTTEIVPLDARPHLDNRYLFYWLKSLDFLSYVNEVGYGVNMPRLGTKEGKAALFVLAPQEEQKIIADKLDELLAQVNNLKARLDAIPAILKRFRESVLAAAVSGKLTEEWRTKLGGGLSSWREIVFSKICKEITVGYVGRMADRYEDNGIPFLRSQNVRAFRFSPVNLLYISEGFHREIYKSRLEPGDLAIVRSGAPGTTCVIPESLGIANCSDLVIARPSSELISDFGCIFMNSEIAQRNILVNKVGVAQQHFNVGSMKKMPINLPPLEEQAEIVRRVDQLFAFADQIEQQVKNAQARVDKLTQSILAKAFRGELTAEWRAANPELFSGENSAEALLKQIQLSQKGNKKLLISQEETVWG
ncbi:restriction endonuclease subunit S [Billgrantia ethanolica]|uniref:Restriction endonuclease subunit S n=1 Tax=Billgrantia ethanolica TaxID=2733486 RepID=A0ABS9A246_9GAMM|nr:restriction endonuclease subunit S [Halomonas ethanolica]MCE8002826.1 restriction endonuclease subunit S [Halomonas ethanolica]